MSKDLISIIIPAYNVKNLIGHTVNSVLHQTYTNLEIIVVDDGSTDGSGEILDRIASIDSGVKVIHKPNGGVTSARMKGIEAATGDWIGFVDGDDEVEPDMYKRLLDNAITYNADISN